jgi:hypothetical protein
MSELLFDEEKHRYTLDGRRLTSVTTIIGGGVPKANLPRWYALRAAEEAWELRDMEDKDRFVELAKAGPDKERDRAAVRGTDIHTLAEDLLHGRPVEVPEELYPYVDGYVRFLDRFHVVPALTEKTVFLSEFSSGGRFDAIGHFPTLCDGPVLWDVKTSNGVYRETKLQTAAYALADYFVEPDQPTVPVKIPEIQATFVAHVTPEGTHLIPLARNRAEIHEHMEFFRAAFQVYRFGLAAHKVADPVEAPEIEFERAS